MSEKIFNNSKADWMNESELSMEEAEFFGSMNESEINRAYNIFEENEYQWKIVEGLSFIDVMRRIRPTIESDRAAALGISNLCQKFTKSISH